MDHTKTISKKAKGGLIASAITLLVALLTLGAGNAFGAEGGLAGLLKKAVGDVAAPVMNAAGGGMLKAESLEGTAYAVLDDNGTLTFIRSTETVSSNATTGTITDIANVSHTGRIFTGIESNSSSPAWQSYKSSIKSVESSVSQTVELRNVRNWFSGCSNLETANLAGLSTGNVSYFEGMFKDCSNLKTVNAEALDTSSATTMNSMFEGCSSLTSINVSGFDTSHVTNMNSMFLYCNMLPSLDVSSFDTSALSSSYNPVVKFIMPYWGSSTEEGALTRITFGEDFTATVEINSPSPKGSPYTTNWIKVADAEGNPIPEGEASPVSYMVLFREYTTEKAGTWVVVLEEGTTHTVTFETNGGKALAPRLVADGGTVSRTTSKSGYSFAGWYTDEELTSSYNNAPIYDDITLYAKWIPAPARVYYYNAAGESYGGTQTVPAGETFTPAVDEPTLAGCEFAGWYTDQSATTPYDFTVPVESNTTIRLYPKFINPSTGETVTGVSATFQGPSYEIVSKQIIPSGSIPEQPEAPTVAGATFDGWYYSYTSDKYEFDEPLTSNKSFQPKYRNNTTGEIENSIITLTFNDLGVAVSKQVMVRNSVPEQPETPDSGVDGVVFAGWYGNYGNATEPYDFVTPQSSNTTFEAKYKSASTNEAVNLVALNFFDADNSTELLGRQKLEKGGTPTRPADPVKDGYTFEGWYTSTACTTPFSFDSSVTGSRPVYAKFVAGTPAPATVDVPVTKTWNDNDNAFNNRPASVTYHLYAAVPSGSNSRSDSEPTLVATQSATAADNYATTFVGLPAEDEHGNALVYCVGEDPVPGYASDGEPYALRGNGYDLYHVFDGTNHVNITNTTRYMGVCFVKYWDDGGDASSRPESITVRLYMDGTEVSSTEMTSANAHGSDTYKGEYQGNIWWQAFPGYGLYPTHRNGQPVTYTVAEDAVTGYESASEQIDLIRLCSETGVDRKGEMAFLITNTASASAPMTGSLSIAKTVAGEGASQSQVFPFTITVAGAGSEVYDGVQFTNDVASVSLSHGQSTSITGLPAGAAYSVSEGAVENYTPSWTNQSGTITAGETAAVSCVNTYAAPALFQPESVDVTMKREDDDPSGDPITLTLVETLPDEITPDEVDTSNLNLVVVPPAPSGPRSYPPTKDPGTNSLVYNFSMDDGDEMTVPIVEGSNVTITNTSPNEDITQDSNSPATQVGQMLMMQTITRGTPIPAITVGATPKSAPAHPQRPQGWIRVNTNTAVNDAVSYEAFKVFDAEVNYDSASGNYNGTHLEWESDAVKVAVMGFLRNAENGTEYTSWLATKYGKDANAITAGDQELAQNAAEYIALMIGNSAEDTTANTTPKTTLGDTFASKLATVLRNYGLSPIAVPANTVTPVEQGYYVVATATSTIGNDEAGTAPIWAPVPQTGYTVEEKVSKPVFNKQVKDNTDVTDAFGKVADASTGQALDFRLTTTLPANVKAFPSYPLTIVDDLPDGMDPLELNQANGYSVHLGEADITSQVVATSSQDGTLTFSIANALALDGVDGNSVITINYRAALNGNATKGSEGNTNTATLTYPADTMTATTAQLTSSAKVLTYQLRVDKVDAANRLNVDGAQFNAKTTIGSTEYWVAQDGSLTTDASQKGTWTTTNGTFTISGLDEGAYSIIEAQAPEHYEAITSPLSVTIDAQKDYAGGTLQALGVSALSGANGNLVSPVTSAADDGYVGSDLGTGIVRVRISDVKQIVLPLTGMPVKTLGIIVGVGIAIASVVALVVKRRHEQDEDEELYE